MICPLMSRSTQDNRKTQKDAIYNPSVAWIQCQESKCALYLYDTMSDQYMCSILVIATCMYEKRGQ